METLVNPSTSKEELDNSCDKNVKSDIDNSVEWYIDESNALRFLNRIRIWIPKWNWFQPPRWKIFKWAYHIYIGEFYNLFGGE